MPFDGKSFKQSILSLEALIAWLETQNPRKRYCYTNAGGCLLTQYFEAHGGSKVGAFAYEIGGEVWGTPVSALSDEPFWQVANIDPSHQTFGAALERARKLLAEQSA